jgi:nitroreductase
MYKKAVVLTIVIIFCSVAISPALGTTVSPSIKISHTSNITKDPKTTNLDYPLPPPITPDMVLEESIFRRKSVRNFTEDPVTDEELSTILWAAYGLREDNTSTVPGVGGINGAVIYVLKEDAAYTYDPDNHSLVFYKAGDWRDIVGWQYYAPVQLGMCYDTDKIDRNLAGAEIGMIDQNIQFMTNALGLGSVVTAQTPSAIDPLGIPENQEGFTVMPIGHPDYDSYDFVYRPFWISLLPRIKNSNMTLSTALEEREESISFGDTISRFEMSQMIWATSGFSLYRDKSDEKYQKGRHRTIPSAKGYYPLDIYAVKNKAIYYYEPNILTKIFPVPVDFVGFPIVTYLKPVKIGNHKLTIADACSEPSIADAPMIILFIIDREKTRPPGSPDLSADSLLHIWYHDAGAGAHNVMLDATAWGLKANIYEIEDQQAIIDLLKLNEDITIPILAVPIGR